MGGNCYISLSSSRLGSGSSACRGPRLAAFFYPEVILAKKRVACFIDGFNVYHSIDDLNKPWLKWVDLKKLCSNFIDPNQHEIVVVYYFSAFATWKPAAYSRHQQYVNALKTTGVVPVMGHFKEKEKHCLKCNARWTGHEEKESDVNIAIHMLNEAWKDSYDIAFLISGDSDLASAVTMLTQDFPEKQVKIIAPVNRYHCKELAAFSKKPAKILELHLQRSLLPETVIDSNGHVVAKRPPEYAPPAGP